MKRLSPLLFLLLLSACLPPQTGKLASLEGTWKREGKEQYEVWEKRSGRELTGYSFTLKEGQQTITETLTLKRTKDQWVYSATVPDQNEGATIPFTLNPEVDSLLSFENLAHDFPRKIQYKMKDHDHIEVRVLGEGEEGFSYLQVRQQK